MKFNKKLLKEKWASYTIAMCSAVVLYLVLTHLGMVSSLLKGIWKIGAPVFMGFIIAYILDPLVRLYSTYVVDKVTPDKLRHTLAVLLSVLSVILFFVVLMVALVPQVVDSFLMFAKNLNGYVFSFQSLMLKLSSTAARHDIDLSKFISSSDELLQSITKILPENVNKLVNASYGFGTRVFDWIISFILAIYMMMDNQRLKAGFVRLARAVLPEHAFQSTSTFWSRCNKILVQYIAYDILDGLIIGVVNWIFMLIMKMPYIAVVSTVVGVTNLAPTFGPMIGAVIGAFVLVLVNPWYALWFLLFTMVLQTFDGYILKPRLFGEQFGVSSVWILIFLILGGRLMGVPGILLAIPCAAISDFVYHDYIIVRLEKLRQEEMKQEKLQEEALKQKLLKQEELDQTVLEHEGLDLDKLDQAGLDQGDLMQDDLKLEEPERDYLKQAGDLKQDKPKHKGPPGRGTHTKASPGKDGPAQGSPGQDKLKQDAQIQEDPVQDGLVQDVQMTENAGPNRQVRDVQMSENARQNGQVRDAQKPGDPGQDPQAQKSQKRDSRPKQKKDGLQFPTEPAMTLAEDEKKSVTAEKRLKTASAESNS